MVWYGIPHTTVCKNKSHSNFRRTKTWKKITVAHITDRATFPGVQINRIEEIELDNVSGLVFVKDDPFSDNPIPSVDVMIADDTERRFHIEDIAFIAFDW